MAAVAALPPLPSGLPAAPAGTVVVRHAHPDDEAIFTGATPRALADRGARVVVVTATSGEEGAPRARSTPWPASSTPDPAGTGMSGHRSG